MTTTPQEPFEDPDIVPSGDPASNPPITPDPDTDPEDVPSGPPPE
jgi:hypothetical protein